VTAQRTIKLNDSKFSGLLSDLKIKFKNVFRSDSELVGFCLWCAKHGCNPDSEQILEKVKDFHKFLEEGEVNPHSNY